jgi:transposase
MTLDGYLPCTGLKEVTSTLMIFLVWLKEKLLPGVNRLRFPMVIVMDNLSIHAKEEVRRVIEEAGNLIVRYLPPYSPDYNPIELTFSVLKAWMKRNWIFLRQSCDTFGNFLELALRESRCDRFARQQFRHAENGVYIEEEELIKFQRHLEQYEVDYSIEL